MDSLQNPFRKLLKEETVDLKTGLGKCHKAFQFIKEKLLTALALGLPDNIRKPSDLFVHERQGISLGILTDSETGQHKEACCVFLKAVRCSY